MIQDWKKVFSSSALAQSSIVMGLLNENDIPAKTLNKQDSSYVFLGEVEVYVPADLFDQAVALIAKLNLDVV
ncbi:MAG: putative prokaryotic signal transducing protein [Bacteroidota bacterium]|jgi:hypothetical protein